MQLIPKTYSRTPLLLSFSIFTHPQSNLRGAAASISEDSLDLEDFELDSFDGEDAFLADPCGSRGRCEDSYRCERVQWGGCRQKLTICDGLSPSECGANDRNCRYVIRNREIFCERKDSCGGMNRIKCNDASPDCRWDQGDCVRKYEGQSDGPTGECRVMKSRQCQRSMHCRLDERDVCVSNLLAELLDNSEMMED